MTLRALGTEGVVMAPRTVDVHTAHSFRLRLIEALESGTGRLRIDLARVERIDVAGVGTLIGMIRRAQASGGQITLARPPAPVAAALRNSGLLRVFHRAGSLSAD